MKTISFISIIIAFIIMPFIAHSQFYSSGQDPASLKWNQINSNNFQIIYPVGYDSVAQYVLNVMEYGRDLTIMTKNIEPKKISIILHNQTIVSNAEVAWAPSRMEFYTVTPQSTYSQEWYQQLAIHEYTHVLQISSMNQGLTKFLYSFFGEQITVGVFGLYIPYWFIEGDAVVNETALSKSGRGRDPNFEAKVRAQLLEIGSYSLEKASLGSYQDYTPDRYHIGYFLVGQGKIDYGKGMWNKPLLNAGSYPLAIVPFATGIKTETGLGKKDFYQQSLLNLRNEWIQQIVKTSPENLEPIIKTTSYTNYTNTNFYKANKIFALKKDYHDIGQFVMLDTLGNEEAILTPGYYLSDYISIGGDWLCWSEYQYDARWAYRSYIKILLYNLQTKEKKVLLNKTRYFSANISPSGKKIAAVEVDEFSQHSLVIIDAQSGEVLKKIKTPDNDFIAHPSWSVKEDKLVAEVLNSYGKGLAIFDLESGKTHHILAYGNDHIQYPTFWEKYVLFEASYSGVMDIYALDLATKSIYQCSKTPFSASDYCLSPNGKKLVFSSYSSLGKQMVMKDWNPKKWTPISEVNNHAYPLADMLSEQYGKVLDPQLVPQEKYKVEKYQKLANAINIHSWNFIHLDANNGGINPGISILSQNMLSTLQAYVGVDYSLNTKSFRYFGSIDYLGWYPVINIGADYGHRFIDDYQNNDTIRYYYQETNMNTTIYLPLLYTSGTWSFRIQPGLGFNHKKMTSNTSKLSFNYPEINSMSYFLALSGNKKTAYQNVFPKMGYSVSISYQNTPTQSSFGEMLSFSFTAYLPGIFRHDGIRLMTNYQDKYGDAAFYNDLTSPARGYTGLSYSELLTLRADYKTPLFYPDWNLSSLIYFKRIVLDVFGDYSSQVNAQLNLSNSENFFWSSGAELSTDVHFLRSKLPVSIGVRATYVNGYIKNPQAFVYELIYGFNI